MTLNGRKTNVHLRDIKW